MKKMALVLAGSLMTLACNQTPKQVENSESTIEQSQEDKLSEEASNSIAEFNIENISFSEADLGDFPFFNLPKGLIAQNKPFEKEFDVCFFPKKGTMAPVEGKLYKINIIADDGEEFSQHYFEKSMEDYLTSVGGVKIFDGEISKEEYERYNKHDPNKGDEGDIGYVDENIKFYIIRSKDKGNIYVQYSSNNASGKLNILLEEPFKQTITKTISVDIINDLSQNGKAIVYINFDNDKSNLTSEGRGVVREIEKVLRSEPNMKIVIEGHTVNTGKELHDKNLSVERANIIKNTLVINGIQKSRMEAKGYGSEKNIVSSDNIESKRINNRIEIVKVK